MCVCEYEILVYVCEWNAGQGNLMCVWNMKLSLVKVIWRVCVCVWIWNPTVCVRACGYEIMGRSKND